MSDNDLKVLPSGEDDEESFVDEDNEECSYKVQTLMDNRKGLMCRQLRRKNRHQHEYNRQEKDSGHKER